VNTFKPDFAPETKAETEESVNVDDIFDLPAETGEKKKHSIRLHFSHQHENSRSKLHEARLHQTHLPRQLSEDRQLEKTPRV
jgi:hypothetical protein